MKLQFNLKSNVGHEKICAISHLHWSRKKSRNWSRLNEEKKVGIMCLKWNCYIVQPHYPAKRLNWITSMTFITMVN